MQQREVPTLLRDIEEAGTAILRFIAGRSAADYEADEYFRSAVERKFEIVGEALREALSADPSLETRITEARRIVDFRNLLIHGYSLVQHDRVWGYVQRDLPRLLAEVRALLPSP
jgi:uncharacterized protein with HEPN domain